MLTRLVALSVLQRLALVPATYWLLWCGSFALSISLIVLLRTRWGQSRPFQKCAALSLLVHALLACLAMTVRVVVGDGGGGNSAPIRVRIVQDVSDPVVLTEPAAAVEAAPALLEPPQIPNETPPDADTTPIAETADEAPQPSITQSLESREPVASVEATLSDEQRPSPEDPAPTSVVEQTEVAAVTPTAENTPATATAGEPTNIEVTPVASGSAEPPQPSAASPVPTAYSLRSSPGRLGLVERQGGNAQTEAAVAAALAWLARAQSSDGRWDANRHGAGQEQSVLGHNRGGAGRNADTGVSALAVLAFLGAGHTHEQGDYQNKVRRGLDFLARSQATDGNLFGDATLYGQMYCHSMATFALAEAQAMTGDAGWRSAITKAIDYSLYAQHAATGGWRYRPGDTGDTSQLGWQLMALASAERAGIDIPAHTWTRARRFLVSVQRGSHGGLASYRADGPPSTSMTAEALYCRLLLEAGGYGVVNETATDEATRQLLTALPNTDRINLYYWYYATLALHHVREANAKAAAAWTMWNDALVDALVSTQLTDGPDAGSWNTNSMWGGYGGRVYTTAMAAMCLESYYRYAPAPPRHRWTATRPAADATR